MDYKKTNAPQTTTVNDLIELAKPTGNIYESITVISKRANQIAAEMKSDLEKKLHTCTDTGSLREYEGYCLTLHVRSHERSVCIVVLKERNEGCGN